MALVSESSHEFRDNFHECHMEIQNMAYETLKHVLKTVILGQRAFTYIITLLTEATHQNRWKHFLRVTFQNESCPQPPVCQGGAQIRRLWKAWGQVFLPASCHLTKESLGAAKGRASVPFTAPLSPTGKWGFILKPCLSGSLRHSGF